MVLEPMVIRRLWSRYALEDQRAESVAKLLVTTGVITAAIGAVFSSPVYTGLPWVGDLIYTLAVFAITLGLGIAIWNLQPDAGSKWHEAAKDEEEYETKVQEWLKKRWWRLKLGSVLLAVGIVGAGLAPLTKFCKIRRFSHGMHYTVQADGSVEVVFHATGFKEPSLVTLRADTNETALMSRTGRWVDAQGSATLTLRLQPFHSAVKVVTVIAEYTMSDGSKKADTTRIPVGIG